MLLRLQFPALDMHVDQSLGAMYANRELASLSYEVCVRQTGLPTVRLVSENEISALNRYVG